MTAKRFILNITLCLLGRLTLQEQSIFWLFLLTRDPDAALPFMLDLLQPESLAVVKLAALMMNIRLVPNVSLRPFRSSEFSNS